MHTSENKTKDDGLIGNEQIEEAIAALQKKPSEELLAHALTVVRSRMREKGQVILAVDMPQEQTANPTAPMQIQAVKTGDGRARWVAFTSFDEELRGGDQVPEIEGVILNPWNRTMMLDKSLIRIVLGES